jgi:hypothetical protein
MIKDIIMRESLQLSLGSIVNEVPTRTMDPDLKTKRSRAALDLVIVLLAFATCALCVPYLNERLRAARGFTSLLAAASYQFCAESFALLVLMHVRRESFASYGYTWKRLRPSLILGLVLAFLYDAAISLHIHAAMWIPLRRQPAIRMSLAETFPLSVVGVALTLGLWGFLEGFFGIYFARKINTICRHSGQGWVTPGVIAFALFNGGVHLIVGQGLEGFVTSFASGYAIAVVPAVTGNAWGGSLVQTLTNAVGRL